MRTPYSICLWATARLALLCALLGGGCGDAQSSSPDMVTEKLVATVAPNPAMVVSALVSVTYPADVDHVSVEHGDTASYTFETPRLPVGTGPATVAVIGLTAGATSHLRARGYHGGQLVALSDDVTFAAAPLPAGFPTFTVTKAADPKAGGFVLVPVLDKLGDSGMAVIVDRTGKPMFYRPIMQTSARGMDFQRHANGHFTLYQHSEPQRFFEELDYAGNLLHTWTDPAAPLGADGHDLLFLPNGHALMMGWASHMEDLRPYGGTLANATVFDATVDEIDPAGNVVFHWNSYPEFTLAEKAVPLANITKGTEVEPLHPNSITLTAGNEYLISFFNDSTVFKLDPATGKVVWRLGGGQSSFTFVDDPLGGFSFQHHVRVLSNGNVLIHDNGINHMPQVTRAVEYRLDEVKHTATMVWQYRHDPDLFSAAGGSAQRLDNGNTLVDYMMLATVSEADPQGRLQWELKCSWKYVYRALLVPTLYP